MPRCRPRLDGDWAWLEQLNAIFTAHAETETIEGGPLLYIQTWLVNHRDHPICAQPRPLRLDSSRIVWLEELRYTWRDLLDHSVTFAVHVVNPRPPQSRYESYACHVLLEQRRPPNRVGGIVTQLFDGTDRDALSQVARTLPHILRHQDVIDELQIQHFCDVRRCTATIGTVPVHLIIAQDIASGFNLRVRFGIPYAQWPQAPNAAETDHFADIAFLQIHADLKPIPIPVDWCISPVPEEVLGLPADVNQLADSDPPPLELDVLLFGSSFMQTTQTFLVLAQQCILRFFADSQPTSTHDAAQTSTDAPSLHLDLASVYDQIYRFEGCFLLPHYHIGHWDDDTTWLQQWWDCQSPVTHLWIYHDGSKRAQGAGSAAVAFLYQPGLGWVFGGALSMALAPSTTSYGAELHAGLLTLQFCFDLLKIISMWQTEPPEILFLHDSTTVGHQITGHWNALAEEKLAALVRHFTAYIEHVADCSHSMSRLTLV